MSNAKHTPGPWLQDEVTATERHVFDSLGEDGLLGPIAIVHHGDPSELEANARLIAAAPELLSVLDRCVGYLADLNGSEWINGDDPGRKDMRQRAKALQRIAYSAVKKAQGIDK